MSCRPVPRESTVANALIPQSLTFWAFLGQVLSPGYVHREVVPKIKACYAPGDKSPDNATSAYRQGQPPAYSNANETPLRFSGCQTGGVILSNQLHTAAMGRR